jgi:hypothetical protein
MNYVFIVAFLTLVFIIGFVTYEQQLQVDRFVSQIVSFEPHNYKNMSSSKDLSSTNYPYSSPINLSLCQAKCLSDDKCKGITIFSEYGNVSHCWTKYESNLEDKTYSGEHPRVISFIRKQNGGTYVPPPQTNVYSYSSDQGDMADGEDVGTILPNKKLPPDQSAADLIARTELACNPNPQCLGYVVKSDNSISVLKSNTDNKLPTNNWSRYVKVSTPN